MLPFLGIDRKEANNATWIQDALAMMDVVANKGPVVIIASSNGTQIAGYIAKIHPQRVKGLILIGFVISHFNFAL